MSPGAADDAKNLVPMKEPMDVPTKIVQGMTPDMIKEAQAPFTLDNKTKDSMLQGSFYRSDEQRYTLGSIGDTIKGLKLNKESERARALRAFSVRMVFANSIVEEALRVRNGDTPFWDVVGSHLGPSTLQYKSEGVAPHLDLEMRCVIARLGGDECITLLLDNTDRHVIRPGALAAWGPHFIQSLHHMIAIGMFMPDRIRLQSTSKSIRWEGVNGVRTHFWNMCGHLLRFVETEIRDERETILREVGAKQTILKKLPDTMEAEPNDPASRGRFSSVFRLLGMMKRKLQLVHDQAAGIEISPVADDLLASELRRSKLITTQEIGVMSAYMHEQLQRMKRTLFPGEGRWEAFSMYYQLAQILPHAGGPRSRYMTRARYWGGMHLHLLKNPFLVTRTREDKDGLDYDQVTKNGQRKLLPEEAAMYYTPIGTLELKVLHRHIETLMDCICQLGMIADILMQVGCLHCMMEASLLRSQPVYVATMRAVTEGAPPHRQARQDERGAHAREAGVDADAVRQEHRPQRRDAHGLESRRDGAKLREGGPDTGLLQGLRGELGEA